MIQSQAFEETIFKGITHGKTTINASNCIQTFPNDQKNSKQLDSQKPSLQRGHNADMVGFAF